MRYFEDEFVREIYTLEHIEAVQRTIIYVLLKKRKYERHLNDINDMVQAVFVLAWKALPTYRWDKLPGDWLKRIAVRVALERIRTVQRQEQALVRQASVRRSRSQYLFRTVPLNLDERVLVKEARALAEIHLNGRQLTVFRLRLEDDMDFKQIAEIMDSTEATMRNTMLRAKQHLRGLVQ